MNRTALKNYAPIARREFIQAITDSAAHYGITANKVEPLLVRGDSVVIGGRQFSQAVAAKRTSLEERVKRDGFGSTMEAIAYTWFNRFAALRYMELHGYLEHGYRVLSHPEGKSAPEVLEHAEHLELPGLQQDAVIDLKIAGDKEEDLYRLILLAQCHALHEAMPFLFERIDDETELLLPDNLLRSDSIIRQLVESIAEEDWKEVEIIGWLYQFYISERNREVIGKVVASEDIPAATQLFTPNWIVKYLVQNTLGRQWLATYPQSTLRQQMEYYIEPAEQTPEVQEQLKAITPTNLNPEELTLLDPACGSGHILVEAYDLFKAIYQERGYRAKDIPALILGKNLFGLEIDDRAAQLAAFALMMKARADDRRIFESGTKPNILAFVDSQGMNANEIASALNASINKDDVPKEYLFDEIQEEKDGLFSKKALAEKGHVSQADIAGLVELFEHAKTFGSLIQVPPKLAVKLPEIEKRLDDVLKCGDLTHVPAQVLKPLLLQAMLLVKQYHAVVANPPYMGNRYLPLELKRYLVDNFSGYDNDLFSAFSLRLFGLGCEHSVIGLMTPLTWMFITTHELLRTTLLAQNTLSTLVQLEYSGFAEATVPICTFTCLKRHFEAYTGTFIRLSDFRGADVQGPKTREAIQNTECSYRYHSKPDSFRSIPGSPIGYWTSREFRDAFQNCTFLKDIAEPRVGLQTGDNNRFLRLWHEVDISTIGFRYSNRDSASKSGKTWFPYNKGGDFRKWYGNNEYVVNWKNGGSELEAFKPRSVLRNPSYYFRPSITWSFVSSSYFGVRRSDEGFLFDIGGSSAFPNNELRNLVTGFMCSRVVFEFMKVLNPTLNFQVGNVASLPLQIESLLEHKITVDDLVERAVSTAREDWDAHERSWDFEQSPLLTQSGVVNVKECYLTWECLANDRRLDMTRLEEANNEVFITAYNLHLQYSPEVPDDQITLYRPNREQDIKRLISYSIGCMMGRYSLDKPGLIYAHSGNEGFDFSLYATFPADDDGIVPILENDWGIHDDATNRFVEFIGVAWPKEHLEENLTFVAESLDPDSKESSREVIRHYLATGFFAHHLQMYKRRPIYWLFSSGRRRAFQALVYLHRYNEGTLARMRTEYVIPLQGKIAASIEQLEGDKIKATSTSQRSAIERNLKALKLQKEELITFDGLLKNYADMRIKIDLDDGVKVNYGKFRDILAEVRAVTGGAEE
jgi:type II restriction/modification system DNA methylase subunit YeeA